MRSIPAPARAPSAGRVAWRARTGLTLLEIAFTVVLVGFSVAALVQFVGTATTTTRTLSDYPLGISIAQAGHEWARTHLYDDLVLKFPVVSNIPQPFNPTKDGKAIILTTNEREFAAATGTKSMYSGWTQQFTMRRVQRHAPGTADVNGGAIEVTVSAKKNGGTVVSLTRVYFP